MRRRVDPSGYRELRVNSSRPNPLPHRINQAIDSIASSSSPSSSQHFTIPTSQSTQSDARRNEIQFSTQWTLDSISDLSDWSDDDDLLSTQTTVGWDSSQANKDMLPPSSQLDEDSYSPSCDDTEALEEAWSEFTLSQSQLSQSQLSDYASSSQIRDDQDSLPPTSSISTRTASPLLASSPIMTSGRDGGLVVNQRSSLNGVERVTIPAALKDRFELVWPQLPLGLQGAPLPVAWEFMRVALHCSINPVDINLHYEDKWLDHERFWADVKAHPAFKGRKLPDMCDPRAWNDSLHSNFRSGSRAVVLTASASLSQSTTGPALVIELHPLKHEMSCRLHRRFGSDRFLDLRIPALDHWEHRGLPKEGREDIIAHWLTRSPHAFLGRNWAAFWVRNEGRRQTTKDLQIDTESKAIAYEKVSFFAVDGVDSVTTQQSFQLNGDCSRSRVNCTRNDMLQWLLQFDKNQEEPYLKLFSRVSLGLTKSNPVLVFREDQIRRHDKDIEPSIDEVNKDNESARRNVMNDGIGRISLSVLRKVRDELGLIDTPCAIQARLGSAKGMWIADVTESDHEDWIETYPKQRKWECDWSDEYHRTLEIKACVMPLKPAALNLQFLPILEDRAIDKLLMRHTIGRHLAAELGRDLDSMKTAIRHPELFRQWVRDSSIHSDIRLDHRKIPFLGGLPDSEQDKMAFLVDGGFDPMKLKYLQKLVSDFQVKKCVRLERQLKIKITKSTYAFMVIDFQGVLAPNEVQLCFSSKFGDDPDGDLDLDGIDVLVARSPAHLPSDIQKVRAVFKPELRRLKDVIIFPRTGTGPLADKLSGGDYDGDKAWVCWEPVIVNNFETIGLPEKPDFAPYLERDESKVQDFSKRFEDNYIDCMIEKAFAFNLKPKFLGICTSYKDALGYSHNSIGTKEVVAMSWFLSELADQAKNGIIFASQHWSRLRNNFVGLKRQLPTPLYKTKPTSPIVNPPHIIDHLRFVVAKNVIEGEFKSLETFCKSDTTYAFDEDLADYWNQFEKALGQPDRNGIPRAPWFVSLKRNLMGELKGCQEDWKQRIEPKKDPRLNGSKAFQLNVSKVYDRWRNIGPLFDENTVGNDRPLVDAVKSFLLQAETHPPELSQWQLLKASMTFKMFYKMPTFEWQIAGRQLQYIKAMKSGAGRAGPGGGGGGGAPIPVLPNLYAALRPDSKYIKRIVARGNGDGGGAAESYYGGDYGGDDDDDGDGDEFEDAEEFMYPNLDEALAGLRSGVGGLSVG